jgi:SAM-dependent methyltransferase
MKVGDLESTSKGRKLLNTYLVPHAASLLKNGDEVLYVGTDSIWDYKPFFWNPGKQCPFFTIEPRADLKPDFCTSMENASEKTGENRFSLVIHIGMWEYFHDKKKAMEETTKVLKEGGLLLFAFPGKGYGMTTDENLVSPEDVFTILKDYRIFETYYLYENGKDISSICVLAERK